MIKIDEKDKKILYELSKDCRISIPKLGRTIALSREVVSYRIKKLVKNGLIQSFNTYIDVKSLGFTKHVVYLELKRVTKEKEKEILNFLVKHGFISWVTISTGKWSFIFDVFAKDIRHFSSILDGLKTYLGEYLGEYTIVTLENFEFFHSKFFGELERVKKITTKSHRLDKVDLKILKLLSDNARVSFVTLATELKLTPEALSIRVKKLRNAKIIKQFFIYPNLPLLDFQHYNVQVNLENVDKTKESRIISYLSQHPKVSFYYKPIGHWDLEFGVFVKNPGELRDLMRDFRNKFPDNVRIFDTSLFYEEFKPNCIPEGVFDYLLKNT